MSKKKIKTYRHPLRSNKLRLICEIRKDGEKYYVYREAGKPGEEYQIRE